ncbi:MAG: hypothetical protein E7466_02905 [Ruminococcaceae bacterium]|nr:hypothetical protein [Oscillospiraceae bacterium]
MPLTAQNQRTEWIDCARGIGILLVVLGHGVYGQLRGIVFSFHMPLFFILSGMTYRLSAEGRQLGKRCKQALFKLILPAVVLYSLDVGLHVLNQILRMGFRPTGKFWLSRLLTLLFSSGAVSGARFPIHSIPIDRMGIPWFLIVLAVGRTLLDLLHLKTRKGFVPICIVLSISGVVIGQYCWLPLSFDVALASLLFLLIGWGLRSFDFQKRSAIRFLVACALWVGTFSLLEPLGLKYMEMSSRRYPLYPLCLMTAVAGTVVVAYVSVFISKFLGWLKGPLMYIGEHSMVMLCVHTLDFLWEDLYLQTGPHTLIQALMRIALDLVVFLMAIVIKNLIVKRRVTL